MKKNFLFISIIAIAFAACKKDDNPPTGEDTFTAITITSSDLGNAGDTMIMNVDTTNLPALSLVSGQNLTWDISMLGADHTDTIALLDPSITPGHNYFTNTNIAIQPEADEPVYIYLNKTTDKVEGIGLWADFLGNEVHAEYADRPVLMQFPMAYNSSYTDSSHLEFILNLSVQWIKSEMNGKIISQVDATGTIKLPNNVSFQCIREKRTEINEQVLYLGLTQNGPWNLIETSTDTTYIYNFFAKNQKWQVASVEVDNFNSNIIKKIAYKK